MPQVQSTFWPVDFPAKTSRRPAKVLASTVSGRVCIGNSLVSWANYDRVGSCLRTYLLSALAELTTYSRTWKDMGTPLGRSWWALTMLGRRTEGSESGLWPTMRGSDGALNLLPTAETALERQERRGGKTSRIEEAVALEESWPTPKAADGRPKGTGGGKDRGLDAMARSGLLESAWPTPTARDWKSTSSGTVKADANSRPLSEFVGRVESGDGPPAPANDSMNGKPAAWPTPAAADGSRASETYCRGNPTLLGAAKEWPTPTVTGNHNRKGASEASGDGLATAVKDWPTPRASRLGAPDSHGKAPIRGVLNPAWVTQLMGLPDGWLDLDDDANS